MKKARWHAGGKGKAFDMNIIPQTEGTQQFFANLWRGCSGDIYLWTKTPQGATYTKWFENTSRGLKMAAEYALKKSPSVNVYMGICPTSKASAIKRAMIERKKPEKVRAEENEVQEVPALWADIDIKSKETQGHHANRKNYAPSLDPWKKKVFSIYPPTYLIKTGGGYHAYWLLKEPFKVQDDESRQQIRETVEKFQACIAGLAGYQIDQTADLARVLRVPGTMNHKTPENLKPVEIMERRDLRYDLSELPTAEIQKPPTDENYDWDSAFAADEAPTSRPQEKKKDRRKGKLTPLERCMRGRSAPIFKAIYGGDISGYPSLSEAVQAMANIAAPRCGNDFNALLEIFHGSAPLWGMIEAKHGEGEKAIDWLRRSFKKAQDAVPQKPAPQGGEDKAPNDPEVFAVEYPDWRINSKGAAIPIPNSFRNVQQVIDSAGIRVKLNTLKNRLEFAGGLGNGFPSVERMGVDAAADYVRILCQKNGLNISRVDCDCALQAIAENHKFNPVQDWLKAARAIYDGGDYLEKAWNCLHLKEGQDVALCKILFRKWFLSAVKIVFNTGSYGSSGVLILNGPQGCGKTRFVMMLSPNREWVQDGAAINPKDKDSLLSALRYWICELGEVGQTLRKEHRDRLKAFFTQTTDTIRKPYGRTAEEMPRNTAFFGTVNEEADNGFLNDSTGNRRFWPITVERVDPPTDIELSQLWGQVMMIAETESEYLTTEEIKRLADQNLAHDKKSAEEILLLDALDWEAPLDCWRKALAREILLELGIRPERVGHLGRALRHLAMIDNRIKVPSSNANRKFFIPPLKLTFNDTEEAEAPPFSVLDGGRKY